MSPPLEDSPRGIRSLWPYVVVLAVGLFVLLPKLGDFGFWDPWEPKYAETAREMTERGSYIVPYYRDSVRLTKPILVYWGILAGAAVFGLNEFGARIGGVCMALVTMAGVFYTVSRLRGRQTGLVAALVLGTAPQFYFLARQAMPDVYLFTSLGLSLLFFCVAAFRPDERRDLHFGLSWACIALAVLAKGPVIIGAVFLTTLAIWVALSVDPRELWLPARRRETLRLGGTVIPVVGLVGALSITAYLFGTSPLWWDYSGSGREEMALVRAQIESTFQRFRLAELLLLAVAGLAATAGAGLVRRGRTGGTLPLGRTILMGLCSAGALGSLAGNPASRILAASLFGVAVAVWLGAAATVRFAKQDWLWPTLEPLARECGRQLLRFVIVFLVVAGPWHIGIFVEQGPGYITDFLIKHNVDRAGEIVNRSGVSDFYLRVLIFGLFPWSCLLPAAIAGAVDWRGKQPLREHGFEAFLLIATLVTFTAFTSSATKFAHYLSPILVPVCVLIGLTVGRTLADRHSMASRMTWVAAAMLFPLPAFDLLDRGLTYLVDSFTMKRWVPDELFPGAYLQWLTLAAGVCVAASIVVRSRILVAGLIAAAALMANHHVATFIPALSPHKTMKNLTDTWKQQAVGGEAPICFFGDLKHGVFFYTDYRIEEPETRESFETFMDPARQAFCIVERKLLVNLQRNHRLRYPGTELHVADDSHFDYVLVVNHRL